MGRYICCTLRIKTIVNILNNNKKIIKILNKNLKKN